MHCVYPDSYVIYTAIKHCSDRRPGIVAHSMSAESRRHTVGTRNACIGTGKVNTNRQGDDQKRGLRLPRAYGRIGVSAYRHLSARRLNDARSYALFLDANQYPPMPPQAPFFLGGHLGIRVRFSRPQKSFAGGEGEIE